MNAEPGEFMGQASSKAPMVTGNAPIWPSAALISTDTKETGLWLWQGEELPSPFLPGPKSRDQQQLLRRVMPAAGWAGWIALPIGLALIFIAVSMMPHPDGPVSADTPAVALSQPRRPPLRARWSPSPRPSAPRPRLDWIRCKLRRRQPLKLRRKRQNRQWQKGVHNTNCRELREEKPTRLTFAEGRYSRRLECSRHRP